MHSLRKHVKCDQRQFGRVDFETGRSALWRSNKTMLACLAILAFFDPKILPDAVAGEAAASLSASLEFRDLEGRKLTDPPAGEAVRISVQLTDLATGRPPRGLSLSGWVRPVLGGIEPCAKAAQAYRVTQNTPVGSLDLNGKVITSLAADGSFVVIDPKLNLQSSNMLAAFKFPIFPASLVTSRNAMRAYATFPDEGRVSAVSLVDGRENALITGLDAPSEILVSKGGRIWVSSNKSGAFWQVGSDGDILAKDELRSGPAKLRMSRPVREDELVAVFNDTGETHVMRAETGETHARLSLQGPISDLAFSSTTAIVAALADKDELSVVFLDTSDKRHTIRVGDRAARVKISKDGRFVFVFKPESSIVSIVDLASMSMVQSAQLKGASVADVAFTENAAFLLSLDGGFVAVINLAGLGAGKPLQLRKIDLGGKASNTATGSSLLVEMDPVPQILAVNPVNQTGWIIPETSRMGDMPPMESTRIRGGLPVVVQSVDRSFLEIRPGLFETFGKLLTVKEQELVLTTGIGGLTACLPFKTKGGKIAPVSRPFTLVIRPVDGTFNAGTDEQVKISLHDESGKRINLPKATFLVPSMQSSWSTQMKATGGEDGEMTGTIRFPHVGRFSVLPIGMPELWELRYAVVLEVKS